MANIVGDIYYFITAKAYTALRLKTTYPPARKKYGGAPSSQGEV